MNTPSPLTPQGSLEDQKNKNRSRVKIAVFFVLGIHVVGLLALLALGGCKKEADTTLNQPSTEQQTNDIAAPSAEPTNNIANAAPNMAEPSNNMAAAPAPAPAPAPVPEPAPAPAPVPAPVPTPAPVPSGNDYKVAKGDTLATIAKKLHVSTKALVAANPGVQPTKLKVGQTLHVPAASTAAAPSAAPVVASTATDSSASGSSYSVKSGDTLSKIATHFHVSIKSLRSANSLKTDRIKVGQKLRIPASGSASAHAAAAAPAPVAPTAAPEPAPVAPAPAAPEAPAAR